MVVGIILDIIIIGILILSIWLGYKKGLTKSLLKIFSFLIAVIISLILFKPIANFVVTQTDIVDNLKNTISKSFKNEEIKDKDDRENEQNKLTIDNSNKIQEDNQNETKDNFTNIFNKYIQEKIVEAGNEAKENVIEIASKEIAIFIVNISVYIVLFLVIRIILIFIKKFAELITKIPGIKQCDELCGGIYGGIRACIIILFIVTILSIILSIFPNNNVLDIIDQSIITKFIYENNIVIKIFF